jgi:hypothetical protein
MRLQSTPAKGPILQFSIETPAGIRTVSNRLDSLLIRALAEEGRPLHGVRSSIVIVLEYSIFTLLKPQMLFFYLVVETICTDLLRLF